jgi:signal transduction histidine kinase
MGQLAGGIAHDFNNILAGILGYTKLALQDTPTGTEARENLEEVVKAASRGRDLVEQILTFSRQSKGSVKRAPHSLVELVQNTMKFLRPTLPSTVNIQLNLESDLPPVLMDPTQMHQVLVNLCVNGCHAMQNKGQLTIALKKVVHEPHPDHPASPTPDAPIILTGPCLLLEVMDTGHGMSAETLRRIFEPFFTTKKRGEGTGMGLAIVYGLVRGHGGQVQVKSKLGSGTIFQIHLPVHRDGSELGAASG